MIILDTALEKLHTEGKPIRVGMIGAGFMARGVAMQIIQSTRGMRLVAIANRNPDNAKKAYEDAGATNVQFVENVAQLEHAISQQIYAVTDNPLLLSQAEGIDIILEVTGTIDYAAEIVLEAIKHKKHVALMNAELDGTLGPLLKTYADQAGVVYTNVDGDQPGVEMNLYRFVKGIGVTPVLCGNIKGLQDPYRTPETQANFAKQWGQKPHMVTSFADGSKISFEQAVVANGTGMHVAKRGMYGPTVPPGTPLEEAIKSLPTEEILAHKGIVDYLVGAAPGPGVFVLGTHDNPRQQHYLNLYKLGTGPLYCFYTPYHLCHFEVPNTLARAVIFRDPALTPLGKPYVEVVTIAKKDLKAGETLDGIGHYMTYGVAENRQQARMENLLPLGLAEGCIVKRDLPKDTALTFDDVTLPPNRLSDELWKKQCELFPLSC